MSEVEVFAKHVESMTKHTLSGPTPLDKEWRVSYTYIYTDITHTLTQTKHTLNGRTCLDKECK